MNKTQKSQVSITTKIKSLELLKMKLETEWRNIFRVLTTLDISKSGTVLVTEFEKCLTWYKVFLTREELDKIYSSFRVGA